MSARGASFLVALLIVAANLRPSLTGVGPLLTTLQADLGLGAAAAGLLGSLPLALFAVAAPFARLAQGHGTEKLLLAALLALLAGTLLRSSGGIPPLYAGTVLLSGGIAVANILVPMLVKEHYPERVAGLTTAYATVMGGFAALASGVTVPLAQVLPGGWRGALAAPALLAVLAIVLWLPQARSRATDLATHGARPLPARLPWRSPLAWTVTAYMGLQSAMFYIAISWYPTYLHDFGHSAAATGWLMTLYQGAALVAGLAVPFLVRTLRDQSALTVVLALIGAASILGLILLPSAAAAWVVLLGIGAGPSLILALTFMGVRASDAPTAAALSLMAQSLGYAMAALGPVVFGTVHDHTGGWTAPMAGVIVLALLKAVCGWAAGRSRLLTAPRGGS